MFYFSALTQMTMDQQFHSVTYFDANAADVGLLAAHVGKQDILGLQVTVDDSFAVEDAHSSSNLLEENPQSFFSQSPLS